MSFYEKIQEVVAEITRLGGKETKDIIGRRAALWVSATDSDLEDYARKTTNAGLFTYDENLRRARITRDRFRRELARTE